MYVTLHKYIEPYERLWLKLWAQGDCNCAIFLRGEAPKENSTIAVTEGLESCGARFLVPRPRIAPLSFAPIRTGPKNCTFYGPDPGPTRLYFPRTGPDRNNLASTRNQQVSTRTDQKILRYGKCFVLRSKI